MIARVLDYEEWSKMPEYMDAVVTNLRPGTSRICVVENAQGEIVAHWLLYPVLFAEDLWVHPDFRHKVSVGRKLWRMVHRCATELGFSHLVSAAPDADAQQLFNHPSLRSEPMPTMMVYPVRSL